eukprot:scaffold26096_cov31-Tisochrysis_lutea.AAC.3
MGHETPHRSRYPSGMRIRCFVVHGRLSEHLRRASWPSFLSFHVASTELQLTRSVASRGCDGRVAHAGKHSGPTLASLDPWRRQAPSPAVRTSTRVVSWPSFANGGTRPPPRAPVFAHRPDTARRTPMIP